MRVADEITRIKNAKESLKISINAKLSDSQTKITNELINNYSTFVDSIESGVDINDYFITEGLTSSKYKIPTLIKKLPPIDISGVTNIDSMFASMESIPFITPMDTSAVKSMANCFSQCKLLANFPITTMENVTNASGAFGACSKLLDVGELNLLSATNVSSMFVNSGVANISMINTSKITNMAYIFQKCGNLKNVPISDFSNVQYAQYAFDGS